MHACIHVQGIVETLKELEGQHSLFAGSHTHPRQMVCMVCGEVGMVGSNLSCEICKLRCHRKCVGGVNRSCKWTTRDQMERDGVVLVPEVRWRGRGGARGEREEGLRRWGQVRCLR